MKSQQWNLLVQIMNLPAIKDNIILPFPSQIINQNGLSWQVIIQSFLISGALARKQSELAVGVCRLQSVMVRRIYAHYNCNGAENLIQITSIIVQRMSAALQL
jgi:hypothetical protein